MLQMKKFLSVIAAVLMIFTTAAADKLPEYNSPEWHSLPGMKEVRSAAENGDADAQYLLACAIMQAKTRISALDMVDREWELKALAQGVSVFHSPIYGRDPEKVTRIHRDFAEKGFYLAQRSLAELLMNNNDPAYLEWYRKAAEQGDDLSQYNLALAYLEGRFGSPDAVNGLKYLELSAAQNNAGALKDLGVFWKDGVGGKEDIVKGIKYLKLAVEKGDTPAAFLLGEIYSEGRGVPVDMAQAAHFFRKAAEKEEKVATQIIRNGDMFFANALACRSRNDLTGYKELLKAAASYGHRKAAVFLLAEKFSTDDKQQLEQAIKEMTLMAEKGNIYAQCYLAFHLRKINRFEEAADWYCRAIGNGEINTFTFYPRMLTEKLSDTQKNYLKGVFLLADHFDDTNMQYVAEFMLSQYIFPENEEKLSYYRNRLLDKKYPKFIFHTLCQQLIYSKLSEEQKNQIIKDINNIKPYLQHRAENGDQDAASRLQTYSEIMEEINK
ncbi:MAG: sel1 repeat family protein [Lentisphaerae bacterium]|nr:sel1 repeat family protein [Lentisphaerota bacterium]